MKQNLESMEKKGGSLVEMSFTLNLLMEIQHASQDKLAPSEQFERETVGDFCQAMM